MSARSSSLIREPGRHALLRHRAAPSDRRARPPASPIATARATQVLYTVAELRRLRALREGHQPAAERRAPRTTSSSAARCCTPTSRCCSAGAAATASSASARAWRRSRSHERRAADRAVRTASATGTWAVGCSTGCGRGDSKTALKTAPDPGSDDTVRRWYLASGAFMARIRHDRARHFDRALELFPDDPEILLPWRPSTSALRACVRSRPLRSMKVPQGRDVRRRRRRVPSCACAEQLYKRALERESDVGRGAYSPGPRARTAWPPRRGRRAAATGAVGDRAAAAVLRAPVPGRRIRGAR